MKSSPYAHTRLWPQAWGPITRPGLAVGLWLLASASCYPIDGDTIACGSPPERVRLWGLDCPELLAPGGSEARNEMALLLDGNKAFLIRKGRDRYGRTLAQVRIQRTSRAEFFTFDAACWMISKGVCKIWRWRDDRKENDEIFSIYKRCLP